MPERMREEEVGLRITGSNQATIKAVEQKFPAGARQPLRQTQQVRERGKGNK